MAELNLKYVREASDIKRNFEDNGLGKHEAWTRNTLLTMAAGIGVAAFCLTTIKPAMISCLDLKSNPVSLEEKDKQRCRNALNNFNLKK